VPASAPVRIAVPGGSLGWRDSCRAQRDCGNGGKREFAQHRHLRQFGANGAFGEFAARNVSEIELKVEAFGLY
jgi:hypothetical protein